MSIVHKLHIHYAHQMHINRIHFGGRKLQTVYTKTPKKPNTIGSLYRIFVQDLCIQKAKVYTCTPKLHTSSFEIVYNHT